MNEPSRTLLSRLNANTLAVFEKVSFCHLGLRCTMWRRFMVSFYEGNNCYAENPGKPYAKHNNYRIARAFVVRCIDSRQQHTTFARILWKRTRARFNHRGSSNDGGGTRKRNCVHSCRNFRTWIFDEKWLFLGIYYPYVFYADDRVSVEYFFLLYTFYTEYIETVFEQH